MPNKYINNNWEGNINHNNLQDNIPNPNASLDQTQQSRDNTNTSQDKQNPSASTEEAPLQGKNPEKDKWSSLIQKA